MRITQIAAAQPDISINRVDEDGHVVDLTAGTPVLVWALVELDDGAQRVIPLTAGDALEGVALAIHEHAESDVAVLSVLSHFEYEA